MFLIILSIISGWFVVTDVGVFKGRIAFEREEKKISFT